MTRASARRHALRALEVLCALCTAHTAYADGRMVAGERELFRRGPGAAWYCQAQDAECELIQTKLLSGFGYLRGHVMGAPERGALHLAIASAALPGGELEFAALDGVYVTSSTRRVRATLAETQGLFLCDDRETDQLIAPLLGIITGTCPPNAVTAIDVSLLTAQLDVGSAKLMTEWLRAGLSWELLANGFAHAHLLRSVMIGIPLDVRTVFTESPRAGSGTSLGAGVRLTGLWRSPVWESRLALRYRTALVGSGGPTRTGELEAELRLLHNFLAGDALILQLGVSLRTGWARQPQRAFALFAARDRNWTHVAALYLGWIGNAAEL